MSTIDYAHAIPITGDPDQVLGVATRDIVAGETLGWITDYGSVRVLHTNLVAPVREPWDGAGAVNGAKR